MVQAWLFTCLSLGPEEGMAASPGDLVFYVLIELDALQAGGRNVKGWIYTAEHIRTSGCMVWSQS
jgi:hypothetical protein